MNTRGFTLFEILIYISLSALIIPYLFSSLYRLIQSELVLENNITKAHESLIFYVK